jgi:hypothetical protein
MIVQREQYCSYEQYWQAKRQATTYVLVRSNPWQKEKSRKCREALKKLCSMMGLAFT